MCRESVRAHTDASVVHTHRPAQHIHTHTPPSLARSHFGCLFVVPTHTQSCVRASTGADPSTCSKACACGGCEVTQSVTTHHAHTRLVACFSHPYVHHSTHTHRERDVHTCVRISVVCACVCVCIPEGSLGNLYSTQRAARTHTVYVCGTPLTACVCLSFDTEKYGMHGDDPTRGLLPCAICVQRFGN